MKEELLSFARYAAEHIAPMEVALLAQIEKAGALDSSEGHGELTDEESRDLRTLLMGFQDLMDVIHAILPAVEPYIEGFDRHTEP